MNAIENIFNSLFDGTIGDIASYPPYDIVKYDDNIEIRVAVAGYEREQITVWKDGNKLIISGNNEGTSYIGSKAKNTLSYVKKGISTKQFRQVFNLARNTVLSKTDPITLKNGILSITLTTIEELESKATKLEIK